jgi:hypothetical protein
MVTSGAVEGVETEGSHASVTSSRKPSIRSLRQPHEKHVWNSGDYQIRKNTNSMSKDRNAHHSHAGYVNEALQHHRISHVLTYLMKLEVRPRLNFTRTKTTSPDHHRRSG